ncbi:DUF2889 domain-containing protein [Trujillonella endophytica]|uniref:DUF2889 domain-containing protein n=1 Tax=Trujillonella endophytica TaxID=673521 RepID=A0A1H8W9D5_9ACTN|nr:DUF2889 domain-containing protein [Trujillella endophytica]SEP23728.1 Protein of unknown function [Trujillella endophytica]
MSVALDPPHGLHDPGHGTPPRAPGSVRRTATTEIVRPEGAAGPLHLLGAARDLGTAPDGTASVLRTAETTAVVVGGRVEELRTAPAHPGTADLLGLRAASGWRTALDAALPDERAARSPLFLLLDDVPVTSLISGYALMIEGPSAAPAGGATSPAGAALSAALGASAGICSGWREDGTMMVHIRSRGSLPPMQGPVAPELRTADADGWHAFGPLPPGAMRRHRRLDVAADPADPAVLVVDAMFRDSHTSLAGTETVLHEYDVRARVDRATGTVLAAQALPRVLPWQECPAAAASAGRLAGTAVADLRARVRAEFGGTSTCTHLTDALRELEDVVALAADLPG